METYILRIYRRSVTEPQAVHGTLEQVGVQGRAAFASSEQLWALLLTPARLGEYSSKRPGTDDADRRREERTMSQTLQSRRLQKVVIVVLCAGLSAPALLPPVAAAEKGKFRGLAVLVSTQFQQIKGLEGHPGGAQMVGELDGVIFNDARQPFLDKAHYQVVWKGDSAGGTCFKSFAMPDGKVFARCEGKPTATGHQGTVELMGGTGRYAGIKGKGNFYLTNVSERTMWDVLEWEYEIP